MIFRKKFWVIFFAAILSLELIALVFFSLKKYIGSPYDGWLARTDAATGLNFKYPERLSAKYARAADWPPRFQVINQPLSCTPGGSETGRVGETRQEKAGNRIYCVTRESQGAAGSIYTMYAYAFARTYPESSPKNKTVIMTFSIQKPQCANYPEPQKTECEKERGSFDIDKIADLIIRSLK